LINTKNKNKKQKKHYFVQNTTLLRNVGKNMESVNKIQADKKKVRFD